MPARKRKPELDEVEFVANNIIAFNIDLDGSHWYEVEWAPPLDGRRWLQGNATWQEECTLKEDGLDWAIKDFWTSMKKQGRTKESEVERLLAVNEKIIAQKAKKKAARSSKKTQHVTESYDEPENDVFLQTGDVKANEDFGDSANQTEKKPAADSDFFIVQIPILEKLRIKNHEATSESDQDCVFVGDSGRHSREPTDLPDEEQEAHEEDKMPGTVWHGRLRVRSASKENRQQKAPSPEFEPETGRSGAAGSSTKKKRNFEAEPIPACEAESHDPVFKSPLSKRHRKVLLKAVERRLETPKKRAASAKPIRAKSLPGLLIRLKGGLPRASTSKVTTRRANQKTTTNEPSASDLDLPGASAESDIEAGIVNEIVRDIETLMQQDKSKEKVPDYSDWQAERHKFDGYFPRPQRHRTMSAETGTNAVSPRCTESRVSTSSVGLSSAVRAQQRDHSAEPTRGALLLPQFRCVPGEVGRHHCSVCDVSFPSRHRLSDHIRSLAHRRCENSQLRGLAAAAAKYKLSIQMPANFVDGSEFARKAAERGEYVLQSQAMQLLNSTTSDHYLPIRSHSSQSLEAAAPGTSAAGMNSLLCDVGAFANSEMNGGTFEMQQDGIAQGYEFEETVSTTYDEYTPNCAAGASATANSYTAPQPLAPMSMNPAMFQQTSTTNVPTDASGLLGGFQALFNQQAMPNLSAGFGESETFVPFPSQSSCGMMNGVDNAFSNSYGLIELSHQSQGSQLGNFQTSQPRHYGADEILFSNAEELQRMLSAMQEGYDPDINGEQFGTSAGGYDFPDSSELRANDVDRQFANPELMDAASGGLQATADSVEGNAPTAENANIDFFYAYNQPEMNGDLFSYSGQVAFNVEMS